jgi:hypothetical protein
MILYNTMIGMAAGVGLLLVAVPFKSDSERCVQAGCRAWILS